MIVQQKYLGYDVIVMTEEESDSKAVICPERGGILLQLTLGGKEIFYLQEETFKDKTKNVRGGNPILFPICGPLPNNEYTLNGSSYIMKQHGFAREKPWTVDQLEPFRVTLVLEDDEETRKVYPFQFRLRFTYELKDGKLTIHQNYENLSKTSMPFYAGFHPYFLGNHSNSKYNIPSSRYLDYSDHTIKERTSATAELDIKDSKIYNQLSDPVSSFKNDDYTLHLAYSEQFKYIVLWSERPDEYICMEPWMAQAEGFSKNNGVIELEPGQLIEAKCAFSIE